MSFDHLTAISTYLAHHDTWQMCAILSTPYFADLSLDPASLLGRLGFHGDRRCPLRGHGPPALVELDFIIDPIRRRPCAVHLQLICPRRRFARVGPLFAYLGNSGLQPIFCRTLARRCTTFGQSWAILAQLLLILASWSKLFNLEPNLAQLGPTLVNFWAASINSGPTSAEACHIW